MPKVSVAVELRVEVEEGLDPVELERKIAAEGRRAARELYREALRAVDEQTVAASGGAKQRTEERWLATTVGRVRLWRYRVKTPAGSYCPLDRALGLDAKEASPALREAVCDLALRLPYRQAAEVASRLTGEPLSHLSCWRILLSEGARCRAEDGELVDSVFELGEAPPEPGADGTGGGSSSTRGATPPLRTRTASERGWRPRGSTRWGCTRRAGCWPATMASMSSGRPSGGTSQERSTRWTTSTWPSAPGGSQAVTAGSTSGCAAGRSRTRPAWPARSAAGRGGRSPPRRPWSWPATSRAWPPTFTASAGSPLTFAAAGCGSSAPVLWRSTRICWSADA